MSAPRNLRELMQTYGLRMVRQKLGDRSRVWLPRVTLTFGPAMERDLFGQGEDVELALLDYVRLLQGKTIAVQLEYPDSCTVTLPTDFGENEQGDIMGLVPFEEMYDMHNPPPAPGVAVEQQRPGVPRWLDYPMRDEQSVGPLRLFEDARRERWFVTCGPLVTSPIVVQGTAADIDALTRAWLAQFVPILRELDMIQEAM